MRSLITAIFIPNYNDAWAENLADLLKEDKKLGKKKSKEFIESVLEELDLSDLESIFFDRKMDIKEDNYDKKLKELKKELDFIIPKLNEAEAKILDTRDTEVTNQTLRRTLERVRDLKLHEIKLPNTEIIKRLAESIKLVDEALAFKGISEAFKNMDKIPPFPPNFPFNK